MNVIAVVMMAVLISTIAKTMAKTTAGTPLALDEFAVVLVTAAFFL